VIAVGVERHGDRVEILEGVAPGQAGADRLGSLGQPHTDDHGGVIERGRHLGRLRRHRAVHRPLLEEPGRECDARPARVVQRAIDLDRSGAHADRGELPGLARTGGRRQEEDRDRDAGDTSAWRHHGARLRDARCLRRQPGIGRRIAGTDRGSRRAARPALGS
jgi:hypothetical protein